MEASVLVIEDEESINDLICMSLEAVGCHTIPFFDGREVSAWLADYKVSGKVPVRMSDGASVKTSTGTSVKTSSGMSVKTSAGTSTTPTARSGSQFPAHLPDLALLDIMLPGKDGFTLLSELKEAGIPVIFLTAKGDVASKVKGLKEGAEDYLVKPFEMLELLARIEKVLDRSRVSEECIRIRDVEIYPRQRVVREAGQEIPFKPMEFDCLMLLAKYKNIALSREQMLNALWGVDFEGETRTIDVHVGRIRRKLEFQDVIKTVPRIGYRLEVQT